MLFFNLSANRYGLGGLNEPLFIIMGQGAAKLWPVKVGVLKKISNCERKSQTCIMKYSLEPKMSDFFQPTKWYQNHSSEKWSRSRIFKIWVLRLPFPGKPAFPIWPKQWNCQIRKRVKLKILLSLLCETMTYLHSMRSS